MRPDVSKKSAKAAKRRKRPRRRSTLPRDESRYVSFGLARLGLSTYGEYLASPHWRSFRRRHIKRACESCGAKRWLCLHHITYARLGKERKADVATLCADCHRELHRLVGLGAKTLGLSLLGTQRNQETKKQRKR